MEYLKTKILLLILLLGVPLVGHTQSFMHSYIDPCTGEYKTIMADMSSPIIVTYYGQIKSFSFEQVSRGDLDFWMNDIYNKYKNTSPCQGAAVTTTTTTSTNQAITLVNNVTNIASLDFSSLTSAVGNVKVDVASTANAGTNVGDGGNNNGNTDNSNSTDGNGNNTQKQKVNDNGSTENGSNGSTSNDNNSNSGTTEKGGGVNNDNSTNSNSGSGSSGNNNNGSSDGNSGGSGGGGSTPKEKETPTDGEIADTKTDAEKQQSQQATKSTSKAKAKVEKPAILVTGDMVGIQSAETGDQDARGTISFTKVKGDGTSSLGGSVDYMVGAKIGNISLMKSWISTNSKGNKGINVVSNSFTLIPGTWSNTLMFVRVNSLKKFTALYGAAGTYGVMNDEPLINTLAIGGFMYKGRLTRSLDATIIMVGVYSPYMKYYTESIFEQQPIVIPFLNLTYKMTKTFGIGLTGGGTYITGSDKPLNYQVLMGAKLII